MENKTLLEKELKSIVLNYLYTRNKITENVTIINELSIDSFSRRADLVVVEKNKMTVFEIKSDADSLYRLSGQLDNYLRYFDKVIIAATKKHTSNILKMIPEQVELWEINKDKIVIKKRGKTKSISNKNNYLNLLKKNELIQLSNSTDKKNNNLGKISFKEDLQIELEATSFSIVKKHIIKSLERRFNLTSTLFKNNIFLKNKVTPEDVDLLSPYTIKKIKNSNNMAINELIRDKKKSELEDPLLAELARNNESPIFGVIPKNIKKLLED